MMRIGPIRRNKSEQLRLPLDGDRPNKKGHPLYKTWRKMIVRCYEPKDEHYAAYGARGIRVYQPWIDSFWEFVDCVGEKPSPEHTLDRINNNGNYEPGNIRWATKIEQANNGRHNRHVQMPDGVTYTVTQLARKYNLPSKLLFKRLKRGWAGDDLIAPPVTREDNFSAMCRAHRLSPDTVRYRMGKGMSLEDALSIPTLRSWRKEA